jgi:glutamate transport system substrate-binding protein
MPSSSSRRVRTAALSAAALLVLGAATACGSSSASLPGTSASTAATGTSSAAEGGDASALAAILNAEQPASATELATSATAEAIKKSGVLVVGGTQTAALFSLLDPATGKLTGFDAEMSELLAKYIIGQANTKFREVSVDTREALLEAHSVNTVFATYTITAARAKKVAFAGPYYEDGLAIMIRKGETGITSVKDLAGKTVVTESGSTVPSAVKAAAPTAKIQLFDTNAECLQALEEGRADAYVIDQGILAGDAVQHSDVEVLPGTFTQEPYGIGLPLDEPDFKTFVNAWLETIEKDGTWAKVWKATIGTAVAGNAPTPPQIG